jgi:hypothetical protein
MDNHSELDDDSEFIEMVGAWQTREQIAYHEAGHAVIAWALGFHLVAADVYSEPKPVLNGGKLTGVVGMITPLEEQQTREPQGNFLVYLAGVIAERRRGYVGAGFHVSTSDYKNAFEVGRKMFGQKSNSRTKAFLEQFAMPMVESLVNHYWPMIEVLAKELLKRGQMNSLELDAFLRERRIYDLEQLDFHPLFDGGDSC